MDDKLPATNWIWIHCPNIDTAVARTLGGNYLHPHGLEERRHRMFDIYRVQREEI
jgi:hypothetical protein